MKNYYLKFPNQAALESMLIAASLAEIIVPTANQPEHFATKDYSLDVIGTIHKQTGVTMTDINGMQYPEIVAQTGWFTNMKADLSAAQEIALAAFLLPTPLTPNRIWAGE